MTDVTQLSDEALVDDCCVAFADAYDPSGGLLANVEAKVRWESHKAELLRRLALRDQQVSISSDHAWTILEDYHNRTDGTTIPLDNVFEAYLALNHAVAGTDAQLPWPQGSGALHPLPKEGWREVDDALAASTQDAPTEVDSDE